MALVPKRPKCPGFAKWKDNYLKGKRKEANVQKKALRVQRAGGTALRTPPTGHGPGGHWAASGALSSEESAEVTGRPSLTSVARGQLWKEDQDTPEA